MDRKRGVYLVLAVAVVVSVVAVGSGLVSGASSLKKENSFAGKRIFLSDDSDTGEKPPFLVPYLSEVAKVKYQQRWAFGGRSANDYSTEEYARNDDYYYLYSDPPVAVETQGSEGIDIGSGGVQFLWVDNDLIRQFLKNSLGMHTLSSARTDQVTSLRRTGKSHSFWLESAGSGSNTLFIKDAHLGLIGINGGPRLDVPDAPSHHRIDSGIRVFYNYDYMIDIPPYMGSGECKPTEINGSEARICSVGVRIEYVNVTRRASAGEQLKVDRLSNGGGSSRTVSLSGISASGETEVRVGVTIETLVNETKLVQVKDNGTWKDYSKYYVLHQNSTTTADTASAVVTEEQTLDVHQRVIQGENQRMVAVDFSGPEDISERRLWSTLSFGDFNVQSGWGMYSKRGATWGTVRLKNGRKKEVDIPDQIQFLLTMRSNEPRVRERIYPGFGGIDTGLYTSQIDKQDRSPYVGKVESFSLSSSATTTGENIQLQTKPAVGYNTILVRGVSSDLQNIRDIHGDAIDFTTSTHEYHRATFEKEKIDADTARFRLTDWKTGEPISGAEIKISNGERDTVTTDENGEVNIQRTGNPIRVRYQGRSLMTEHEVYYSATRTSIVMPIRLAIDELVYEILIALVTIIGFLSLYVPIRIIRRRTAT